MPRPFARLPDKTELAQHLRETARAYPNDKWRPAWLVWFPDSTWYIRISEPRYAHAPIVVPLQLRGPDCSRSCDLAQDLREDCKMLRAMRRRVEPEEGCCISSSAS